MVSIEWQIVQLSVDEFPINKDFHLHEQREERTRITRWESNNKCPASSQKEANRQVCSRRLCPSHRFVRPGGDVRNAPAAAEIEAVRTMNCVHCWKQPQCQSPAHVMVDILPH